MLSYFVQHGIAESSEINANRPLTEHGRKETQHVASHLKRHGVKIDNIYHSGKQRAVETATIFASVLNAPEPSLLSGMSANDEPNLLIGQIKQDSTMFVGHLPNMQRVVSTLLTGDDSINTISFKNSAVACIEQIDDSNHLKWFLTADLC